jgi:alginate O-acetyltransferase complex protein AlgI
MAIGMGRMFGFHFRENFDYPYVARSIGEFWRRWHISLSTWFRDYLYIPLGGNLNGKFRTVGNLLLVMGLCGLWHGANWTFVCWGLFHGILLAGEYLGLATVLAAVPAIGRAYTLIMLTFGWAIFRSENLAQVSNLWAAMAGAGSATDIPPWYDLLPNDVLAANSSA